MSADDVDPAAELAELAHALAVLALARGRRARRLRAPRASRVAQPAEPAAPVADRAPRSASTGPAGPAGDAGPDDTPETMRARAAACGTLAELADAVTRCRACALHATRTRTVFSDGDGSAGVLFVGEAPGEQEDLQGVPFVGPAGRLLTTIIEKGMRVERKRTYVANVLKCRPPGNRDPAPAEKALCTAWLERQIDLVGPKVIVALGRHAAGHLLATDAPLARLRGRVVRLPGPAGRKLVATYHPSFLLRSPERKPDCWSDIQLAMAELGIPVVR